VPHDSAHVSHTLSPPPALDVDRHALFLDLDGTLVEIAARPEDVVAGKDLCTLLRALAEEMHGALAVITGRTIESAERVLNGAVDSIAGIHGFERRFAGEVTRASDDISPVASAASEARALLASGALRARLEDKHGGLALHYRDIPDAAADVRRIAAKLAEKHGLSVIEGKMVAELTLGVRSKGDAVRAFMNEAPFAGRIPLAVGDDITDEDAFAAAYAAGGYGILVGPPKRTAARHILPSAATVTDWITARRA
jgi:trehalose 6-phosphate phosphatase